MRDYANPALLLLITALFAWTMTGGTEGESAWAQPGLWLLTVCATGCLVNGVLCLARGLAHRPVLAGAVWSMVHLVLGSCAYVYLSQDTGVSHAEAEKYRVFIAQPGLSPYAADEEGDTLLSLAAGMGKEAVVRRLLERHPHGEAELPALVHAAWTAAQHGQDKSLRRLLVAGVSPDAVVADGTLLTAAVNSGKKKAVVVLAEQGADVNKSDAEGNTPFLYAVMNGDIATARYLKEHGADTQHANSSGMRAADYSRSSAMDQILVH